MKGEKCKVRGCRCRCKSTNRLCPKHNTRTYAHVRPEVSIFYKRRYNAGKRGITWDVPLPCFLLWCAMNRYAKVCGRTSGAMQIDRKYPWIGYVFGNMQLLEAGDNVRKHRTDSALYGDEHPF